MSKINLIGINGRIGNGKDTVGSIIQYLTSESGNSNSSRHRSYEEFLKKGGGSTLRNFDHHYVSDWKIKKFAGKLKQIASILTGIPVEKFEDQEFKKIFLGEEWDIVYFNELSDNEYTVNMSVRSLLQKLGTEAMRDNLHPNVWCNALFSDYKTKYINQATAKEVLIGNYEYYKNGLDSKAAIVIKEEPNWIITDMRFPNELQAVKDRGGICIRVNRLLSEGNRAYTEIHPSETALDNATFDYVINNNGTIEDLIEEVRKMLQHFKIIE